MEWLHVQKLTLGDCIPCLPNIREYDHEKLRNKYEQAKYIYLAKFFVSSIKAHKRTRPTISSYNKVKKEFFSWHFQSPRVVYQDTGFAEHPWGRVSQMIKSFCLGSLLDK